MIDTQSHVLQQNESQDSESPLDSADEWGGKANSEEEINQLSTNDFDLTGQAAMQAAKSKLSNLLLDPKTLEAKVKNWRNNQRKRFGERKKFGFVEPQKELLPPEVLR